jgi:8-oxo-dGTP diphosphatase
MGSDDRRAGLLDLLAGVGPLDAEEAAHRAYARQWVGSGAPLYRIRKPDVPTVHLVSYFMVLDPATGRLLLVDHRRRPWGRT